MGRRGSTVCDRICLVGARGWLLIGGDQVVVALRVSAATATTPIGHQSKPTTRPTAPAISAAASSQSLSAGTPTVAIPAMTASPLTSLLRAEMSRGGGEQCGDDRSSDVHQATNVSMAASALARLLSSADPRA